MRFGPALLLLLVAASPESLEEDKLTASDGAGTDWFGNAVSRAGDGDGDGYDDLIIGAWGSGTAGAAYVYYGSATGIDGASEQKPTASDGAYGDTFGCSVSDAGDVDGDGYDDLIVGAYQDDDNGLSSGSAYVYYGSATGIDVRREDKLIASDGFGYDHYGFPVSGAGDVDGDGFDDVIVAASAHDDSGAVYLYYGSATGIDSGSEHELTASDSYRGDYFGCGISDAGDVDADGFDDVIVGAYGDDDRGGESGGAYVYFGSATGIDVSREHKLLASDGADYDYFGNAVSGGGDVDGDGYHDVIVGAQADDDGGSLSGSAYVYYGSATGIDGSREDKLVASDGAASDRFGFPVSDAGDIDGDGFDDLVVGARYDDNLGSAYVYYGSATGIDSGSEYKLVSSDGAISDMYAEALSGAGDVDGDGFDDLVIGANKDDDNGLDSGSVYVYRLSFCSDEDEDGYCAEVDDCDDGDAAVNPDATELTGDEVDSDCDGTEICHADADADGYTDGSVLSDDADCSDPGEATTASEHVDCDDADAAVNPGATELCDGVDNDCDGSTDDDAAADAGTWYADSDGDGFGDPDSSDVDCVQPTGFVEDATDCDDGEAAIHPDATELCDGVDNDCDGTIDDYDAADAPSWYADGDGDGFGDPGSTTTACSQPSGYVGNTDDCDDGEPLAYTGATELCDGVDNDCDDTVDNDDAADASSWYADSDGDGFGDAASTTLACEQPSGFVSDDTDCDDADASVFPGAEEVAGDGIDQDCDGADATGGSDDTGEPAEPGSTGCPGCASGGGAFPGGMLMLLLGGIATRRRSCRAEGLAEQP